MFSRDYIFKNETVSTSSDLKETVRSAKKSVYAVICAEEQSGGRGRTGKSFFSPKGGLYFSASFPLGENPKNAPFITLLAGLCVCRALQKLTPEKLYIKWPNDIYLNGKKLCGILTENVNGTAVVGIGINCDMRDEDIPDELKNIVTSLAQNAIAPPDKKVLMYEIVDSLDEELYEKNALSGETQEYVREINSRFYLRDKPVKIVSGETVISGKALCVSESGALILLTENGTKEIISGEVNLAV
ncbi:MAG: biotin--[acetyl-CoA-carboxylase] ligase [Oscillospiraceae bacterium]|nr:biotin--[acetyl-CoA-carboxylase] ligase [Oscillospiraceae bacterium]